MRWHVMGLKLECCKGLVTSEIRMHCLQTCVVFISCFVAHGSGPKQIQQTSQDEHRFQIIVFRFRIGHGVFFVVWFSDPA